MTNWLQTIRENYIWLLLPLFAFPILSNSLQSASIILVSGILVIVFKDNFRKNRITIGYKPIMLSVFWVVVMFFTFIYSPAKVKGLDYIIRLLSLLIFPLLFYFFLPRTSKTGLKVISIFYVGIYVFITFFIYLKILDGVDVLGYLNDSGVRIKGLKGEPWLAQAKVILNMPPHVSRYYLNENEVNEIFIHKAYISMGYVWGIFLILNGLKKEPSLFVKSISVFIICLFTFMVFYFTSMPNILLLLILLFGFTIYQFLKLKSWLKLVIIISSFLLLTISFSKLQHHVFQNDRLISGVEETRGLFYSFFKKKKNEKVNIRNVVWDCAINAICEKPFFGYGVGTESQLLERCYKTKKCEECAEYSFNAHNQFFSMALNGGFFLLISFVISLLSFFRLAYLKKDKMYFFFLLLFTINIIGESMLVRIHGILFFALFNSLFFSTQIENRKSQNAR